MDAKQWMQRHAESVSSQYGEDGLLSAIFSVLSPDGGYCVEFGAADGVTSSNVHQLIRRGWDGLLIEPRPTAFARLELGTRPFAGVTCFQSYVTLTGDTTLDRLLKRAGSPAEPDLLSVDVDGLDYHIWATLEEYSPKVVVIEYNPSIPNSIEYVQPPKDDIARGSSIRSLVQLATMKGYELAAVTENNGIFVRADLFAQLGLEDNDLESLRDDAATTTIVFQGYDGRLILAGNKRLLWHRLPLDAERIQPIPRLLRKYPERLTAGGRVLLHAWSLAYMRRGGDPVREAADLSYHRSMLTSLVRHIPTWIIRRIDPSRREVR